MKWLMGILATAMVLLTGRAGASDPVTLQAPRADVRVVPPVPLPIPPAHVPAPSGTIPVRPGVLPMPPGPLPVPPHAHFHVKYRCPPGANRSFQNHLQARQFETRLKELGFATRMTQQPGRYCVFFQHPQWGQKCFPTLAQAQTLETWLKSLGCQTQIVH